MKRIRALFVTLLLLIVLLFLLLIFQACKSDKIKDTDTKLFQSYVVTFDLGYDDIVMEQNSSSATGKVSRPITPERNGYSFIGWYDSKINGNSFDFDSNIESDITIFAQWKKNLNKIHFEGNGQTNGIMDDVEIETDSTIKLPLNTFVKTGYSFIGWSDSTYGSVKNVDGGWFFMDDAPIVTLFARWVADTYLVTLDAQDGVSSITEVSAVYDSYLGYTEKPQKPGFVFCGYFSELGGRGDKYYDSEMNGVCLYQKTDGLTLYAHWVSAINTVTFHGNGNTEGSTEIIESATWDSIAVPACGYTRLGYTFIGWNTSCDGDGDRYLVGSEFVVPASDDGIILYAEWRANVYYIVFDDNNQGERISVENTYDEVKALPENIFEIRGYNFICWCLSQDGDGEYYQDEQEVLNLCDGNGDVIILYAIWTPVTSMVILNKAGGNSGTGYVNVVFGTDFPRAIAPLKDGYIFDGYYAQVGGNGTKYLDADMKTVNVSDIADNNTEIFANWIPKENIIIFEANGAYGEQAPLNTLTDSIVVLPDAQFNKAGYKFNSWNTKASGDGDGYMANTAFIMPASENAVKLYAIWVPLSKMIMFDGNGSTYGQTKTIIGVSDEVVKLPDCGFIKSGYSFVGWSTTLNGDIINVGESFIIPAIDIDTINIFARWELDVYKITYIMQGGINSVHNPNEYTYLDSVVLSNPTRMGYKFTGWTDDSKISINSTGDRVFTANWEIVIYSITYILNGGNNNPKNPTSYSVESETINILDPNKSGFDFQGWSEGNIIDAGSIGDRTFTAEWNGLTYKIYYELDGGSNNPLNPGSYSIDDATIIIEDPVKAGYSFIGWEQGNKIPSGSTGDKLFTAQWQIQIFDITYVLNGGTNSEYNVSQYTVEDDDIFIYDAERNGFIFEGWQEGIIIESGSTGNKTFTALWNIITYKIICVDEYGNVIPVEPSTYTIESDDIVLQSDLTKDGYNFRGWKEGEYEPSLHIVIESGSTGTRAFVAIFEVIEYQIFYELNGGENSENNPLKYTIEDGIIILEAPIKDGFIFDCWKDEDGNVISEIACANMGDITLIANWIEIPDPEEDITNT